VTKGQNPFRTVCSVAHIIIDMIEPVTDVIDWHETTGTKHICLKQKRFMTDMIEAVINMIKTVTDLIEPDETDMIEPVTEMI
jgi:uncharacterized membrane protein